LSTGEKAWVAALGERAAHRKAVPLPGGDGGLSGYVFDPGGAKPLDSLARSELTVGLLPTQVAPGSYRIDAAFSDPELAAIAWGLGSYQFRRYKTGDAAAAPVLQVPVGVDARRVATIVDGVWFGRDLINTPANDMGPDELEHAARRLASASGAEVSVIVGEALIDENFPLIHAVGRAAARAPRLIDLRWGRIDAPKLTIIGKGVCFDTGGLDIKPSSGMLLMKKDMGGAATALVLAHLIMSFGLDVRLRVLIPAVENAVGGSAFRPGDIIRARNGRTVEIGNTDAEGRLVLADAMSYADEETPDTLLTFATLTGAARVALGPDLPPLYTDDDAFADAIVRAGLATADPVWRMPLWRAYEAGLDSPIADTNNVSEGAFAGSITAALFLRKFVTTARRYAHFDIFGWRPAARPLGPKGGEPQAARAMLAVFEIEYGRRT
jgi:leucyl aminopeptidase